MTDLKRKLDAWADDVCRNEGGDTEAVARRMLEMLWPVIEAAASAERYLDLLGYIPANSRQRELSEELWECAMFERDKLSLARAELEGKLDDV